MAEDCRYWMCQDEHCEPRKQRRQLSRHEASLGKPEEVEAEGEEEEPRGKVRPDATAAQVPPVLPQHASSECEWTSSMTLAIPRAAQEMASVVGEESQDGRGEVAEENEPI